MKDKENTRCGEKRGGQGPCGHCICPRCGIRIDHRRGIRCDDERCPQCAGSMLREGSYHHRLWLEKHQPSSSV